jgi:hypothetical protein
LQCSDDNSDVVGVSSSWYDCLWFSYVRLVSEGLALSGIEYWQYTSPSTEETTRACDPEGEDPQCSACIPTKGINPAHWTVHLIFISPLA